ncbi:hypothetical protein C8J56DRAFT_1032566 [Mycena floridula]|nr:hypothetical protein C8J56DRAFT_1032566 [Mycena floridula]
MHTSVGRSCCGVTYLSVFHDTIPSTHEHTIFHQYYLPCSSNKILIPFPFELSRSDPGISAKSAAWHKILFLACSASPTMPKNARPPRLGIFCPSPYKLRNPKKTQTIARSATRQMRGRQLEQRIREIEAEVARAEREREKEKQEQEQEEGEGDSDSDGLAMVDDSRDEDFIDGESDTPGSYPDLSSSQQPLFEQNNTVNQDNNKKRRIEPDQETSILYSCWQTLLPQLVAPYQHFQNIHHSQPLPLGPQRLSPRCFGGCILKTSKVQCLYLDSVYKNKVTYCNCQDLCTVLVANGLFPATPDAPRTAFSYGVLEMYKSLFERSCDAINAMSSALQTFYERRGFAFTHKNGALVKDAFRMSLSGAVQWYDCLGVLVTESAARAVAQCAARIEAVSSSAKPPEEEVASEPNDEDDEHMGKLKPGQCAQFLQDLCPACFGGRLFGRTFQQGGDIHVSTDGNFHHRHFKSAGDTPSFYCPSHFVSKKDVDDTHASIDLARKRPAPKQKLPNEAVDGCKESHQAAKPERKKGQPQFNDHGLMSLVCRHDVPLLFANIDTPGEGQQYAVALINQLFAMLPAHATVVVLYDLACVLDRSSELYEIFSPDIASRMQFATTAMHAYAHQWSCQLVFNPRMRTGLGITDGEGVERIWSALQGLIPITRHASCSRRIWMLDRLIQSTAAQHRDTLGEWIRNKLIYLKETVQKHKTVLQLFGEPSSVIRAHWEEQKAEQTSIRAHLPARLKKELEDVLALQSQIDSIDATIQSIRSTIRQNTSGTSKTAALAQIELLEEAQTDMKAHAEVLYALLNVTDTYPELQGIALEFVQILLLARDLKISLRKRIIGSFFETDRLDQAVGGGNEALGTKAHQIAWKGIGKRAPALANDISKFNGYVDSLQEKANQNPSYRIPIPNKLPTTTKELRETEDLLEDVWISNSPNA